MLTIKRLKDFDIYIYQSNFIFKTNEFILEYPTQEAQLLADDFINYQLGKNTYKGNSVDCKKNHKKCIVDSLSSLDKSFFINDYNAQNITNIFSYLNFIRLIKDKIKLPQKPPKKDPAILASEKEKDLRHYEEHYVRIWNYFPEKPLWRVHFLESWGNTTSYNDEVRENFLFLASVARLIGEEKIRAELETEHEKRYVALWSDYEKYNYWSALEYLFRGASKFCNEVYTEDLEFLADIAWQRYLMMELENSPTPQSNINE